MSSSSVDPSPHTGSEETLTIENIISTLSTLPDYLTEVLKSIPECGSSDNRQSVKFKIGINQIREVFHKLKNFKGVIGGLIKNLECGLSEISDIVAQVPNEEVQAKLSALNNNVTKLKFNIRSLPPKMSFTSSDTHPWNGFNSVAKEPFIIHRNDTLSRTGRYAKLRDAFTNLGENEKLCLLSFAVLPVDVVVKRRLLIYWWVGECLVDPPATGEETAEDIADRILGLLMLMDFIKPVKQMHKQVPDRFRMGHVEHSVVISLALEFGFFRYDLNGNPISQKVCDDLNLSPTAHSSNFNRACLMKAGERTSEQLLATAPKLDQEKLQTIFNVNEPNPDLRFQQFSKMKNVSIVEWFSKMKNISVLYLGRWQSSDAHDIEVQSTEFLKGLKNMNCLRLLSLQGISEINEIPNSIEKLTNLRILDLKACHSLEALPDGIALLKQLSHLDMSECYLLDSMPKGLASLSKLQVLKGFVIGNLRSRNSCTLEDLIGLKKLNKLSINTSSKAFPRERELHALKKLEALRKLAIAWDSTQQDLVDTTYSDNSGDNEMPDSVAAGQLRTRTELNIKDPEILPTKLEKLELKSFPHKGTPAWLKSGKLENLKKLYIRGGKLCNLDKLPEGNKWKVEILRLKYLKECNMQWEDLQELFPNLTFLENVDCPGLNFCLCDSFGVWQACQH